ncbi:MAG TPA: rhomboid family intramembrane serine protease [Thermoleophilaceae bacterium]|nr:rhomboid family intramembrane serine protease [Thermoleophilaceae bacterium]
MEACYRHPNRETGVHCSNCGRPICPDCMTSTPVGMRCPECARQRTRVRTMRSAARSGEPVLTYALIAINVVAFIGELAGGASAGGGSLGTSRLFADGALRASDVANGDYWRLITAGFLHASVFHIFFNMFALWILGQMLEPAIGSLRFGLIYFVSLLAGSFGALLVTPDSFTVGASGAIFGLMGAAVVVLRNRGINPMESGLGLWIGLNLLLTFTLSNISIGGHIGGLIGGTLAALVLFEGPDVLRLSPQVANVLCAGLGVVAVVGSIAVA